ncbi:hypothetical protein BC941DRAFT_476005 [Chlamydoabsidia padenii]|nr:hypothetical protein BC941DRAFT_476005 [Chlamydoabsidia padenii]
MEGVLGIQIVGRTIRFYVLVLRATATFVMYLIAEIKVPDSIQGLPGFITELSSILKILHVFKVRQLIDPVGPNEELTRGTIGSRHGSEDDTGLPLDSTSEEFSPTSDTCPPSQLSTQLRAPGRDRFQVDNVDISVNDIEDYNIGCNRGTARERISSTLCGIAPPDHGNSGEHFALWTGLESRPPRKFYFDVDALILESNVSPCVARVFSLFCPSLWTFTR